MTRSVATSSRTECSLLQPQRNKPSMILKNKKNTEYILRHCTDAMSRLLLTDTDLIEFERSRIYVVRNKSCVREKIGCFRFANVSRESGNVIVPAPKSNESAVFLGKTLVGLYRTIGSAAETHNDSQCHKPLTEME